MKRKTARKLAKRLHKGGYRNPEIIHAYKVPGWYLRVHIAGYGYTLISRREVNETLKYG